MKKNLSIAIALVVMIFGAACSKDAAPTSVSKCESLPHTAPPTALAGNWASGFVSLTQIVDAYDGRILGNSWQSGKFFRITNDGRNAQFYYMAQSQYSQSATQASGSIAFDAGSTSTAGSFTFSACSAHYKGWGSNVVDRDATQSELSNNLTAKYYYRVDGQWLRIEPNGPVNDYSSSFRLIN